MGLLDNFFHKKSSPETRSSGESSTRERVKKITKGTVVIGAAAGMITPGAAANAQDAKMPTPDKTNTPPGRELRLEQTEKQRQEYDEQALKQALKNNKDRNAPDPQSPPPGYKTIYDKSGNFSFVLKTGKDYERDGKSVEYRPLRTENKPTKTIHPDQRKHRPEFGQKKNNTETRHSPETQKINLSGEGISSNYDSNNDNPYNNLSTSDNTNPSETLASNAIHFSFGPKDKTLSPGDNVDWKNIGPQNDAMKLEKDNTNGHKNTPEEKNDGSDDNNKDNHRQSNPKSVSMRYSQASSPEIDKQNTNNQEGSDHTQKNQEGAPSQKSEDNHDNKNKSQPEDGERGYHGPTLIAGTENVKNGENILEVIDELQKATKEITVLLSALLPLINPSEANAMPGGNLDHLSQKLNSNNAYENKLSPRESQKSQAKALYFQYIQENIRRSNRNLPPQTLRGFAKQQHLDEDTYKLLLKEEKRIKSNAPSNGNFQKPSSPRPPRDFNMQFSTPPSQPQINNNELNNDEWRDDGSGGVIYTGPTEKNSTFEGSNVPGNVNAGGISYDGR